MRRARPLRGRLSPLCPLLCLLASCGARRPEPVVLGAAAGEVAQPDAAGRRPRPDRPPRIWVGHGRLCGSGRDGGLWCMGKNNLGQLGDGTTVDRAAPVVVEGARDVADVALGLGHSCASTSQGKVLCWGDNALGQVGDGTLRFRLRPQLVEGPSEVDALFEAGTATFARREDGSVLCWGMPCPKEDDSLGEIPFWRALRTGCLGDVAKRCFLEPVAIPGLSGLAGAGLGEGGACGVRERGELLCKGARGRVPLPGVGQVRQILAHGTRTCALERSGKVLCWEGALPLDEGELPSTPSRTRRLRHERDVRHVATLRGAMRLAWNKRHLYGLRADGSVLHAGARRDIFEPRGDGELLEVAELPGLGHVVDIGVDEPLACVARREGSLLCAGELPGLPPAEGENLSWEAVAIPGLARAKAISSGSGQSCAVLAKGAVSCFGRWVPHRLGSARRAQEVPGLADVVEVDVGDTHACARERSGRVRCWHLPVHEPQEEPPYFPLLGHGERGFSLVPVVVAGLADATQLAVVKWHACAVRRDGRVSCWGLNDVGQLGDGTTEERLVASEVPGLTEVEQVVVGRAHSCALRRSGEVWCWGGNGNGQLGDGTTTDRPTPTRVEGLAGVAELGGGQFSSCARTKAGEVLCWGFLGCDCDEGRHHQTRPKLVPGLPRAAALRMGPRIQCSIDEAGEAHCWNHHVYAREFAPPGRGGSTRRPFVAPVAGRLADVAPGSSHVCALTTEGEVRCWGDRDVIGVEPRRGLFVIEPP